MRKSILSAYLMGAIALATTSTFVSCKDYDDDITNLQEQIDANSDALKATEDALKSEISILKSQLKTAEDELNGLIKKAQAAADAAQASANAAQSSADKAQSAANAAQATADAALNAANAAQATADANTKKIEEEILPATAKVAGLEARIKTAEDALAELKDLVNTKVNQEDFNKAVDEIYGKIAAVNEDVAKNLESIEGLKNGLADEVKARKALAADLEEQKIALTLLTDRIAALEGSMKTVQDDIKVMKENIAKAQADIVALQAKVADNTASIESIKEDIIALDARLVKAQTTADVALEAANKALEAAAANKAAIEDEAKRAKAAEKAAADAAAAAQTTADKAVKDAAAAKAAADKAQAAADKAQAAADKNAADLKKEAETARAAEQKAQATADKAVADAKAAKEAADAEAARAKKVEAELQGKLDKANEAIAKAQKAADDAQAAANAAQDSADAAQAAADKALAEIDVLTVYVHHALRSLVFDVEEYYWGVEAVNIKAFAYRNITVDAADVTKDQVNDNQKIGDKMRTGDNAFFSASYFLNPSGANVSENPADYNFVNVKDNNYTRVAACGDLNVCQVKKGTGKVYVKGTVESPELIKDIMMDGKVTVFALQYNEKDSVITSDFAALRRSWIKDFAINMVEEKGAVDKEKAHNHLATTAEEAASQAPVKDLKYNDATGINLDEWINAHANISGLWGACDLWGGQNTLNEAGFELKYELIGYDLKSEFNESQFAVIEGSTLKAKDPKNAEPQVHMIGHTPLVRVKLINKNDNNTIVALGYFKVVIIGETNNVNLDVKANVNLACDSAIVINADVLTDAIVKDSLMSVEAFQNFKLVVDEQTGVAKQFDAKHNETTAKWGEVTESTKEGYYLNIKVNNGEAYAAFTKDTKKSVTVKYYNEELKQTVYATINVTNDKLLVAPKVVIDNNEDKVVTSWFAHNSPNRGFDEIHAHVEEGQGTVETAEWNFGLDDANWKIGNVVTPLQDVIASKSEVKNFRPVVTYSFIEPSVKEVGLSGEDTKATISVKNNGSELWAKHNVLGEQLIATLNTKTGKIDYKKVEESALAGEILNYMPHDSLKDGETFTARVAITTTVCDPIGEIVTENNAFDVKFLRPISFENSNCTVTDAVPDTYTQEVKVSFYDWRNWYPADFTKHTGKDFATFYGLKSLKQARGKIKTNYASGGDIFEDVAEPLASYFSFKMNPVDQIVLNDDGTLNVVVKYSKDSQVTIHEFVAKIPVVLEYTWGKLYDYITVTVKPTEANASKVNRK